MGKNKQPTYKQYRWVARHQRRGFIRAQGVCDAYMKSHITQLEEASKENERGHFGTVNSSHNEAGRVYSQISIHSGGQSFSISVDGGEDKMREHLKELRGVRDFFEEHIAHVEDLLESLPKGGTEPETYILGPFEFEMEAASEEQPST